MDETIPVTLSIICPEAPHAAKLLASNVHVVLVKRSCVRLIARAEASVRETVAGAAGRLGVDESVQGVSVLYFELRCQERSVSCSWHLKDVAQETVRPETPMACKVQRGF